ncbi:hypothetical protein V5O48_012898 [Marasmius crinis-equi]|uniref:Protein root UVB sensitive/RUS domain-containing protein n=1 Tax=Marasmius crinis-equi TaxID=585013 RepID=A0ABR3F1K3_9AGAR
MKVVERDATGALLTVYSEPGSKKLAKRSEGTANREGSAYLELLSRFMSKVFLPEGYPKTVSPDYMRYQILNALQAFCSSLAGMLSSRATLEGYGVGNASASATNALLLTVLQDATGRLTTILAAYHFGSSLMPEAKTYRFLADILNDIAIVLDTLSPLLATLPVLASLPKIIPVPFRVYTLCISSSLRALCGIAAGGSKTAITLHFSTPLEGTGNLGDLNAKDSSKETVLGLMGMLLGTLVVPYLTTPFSTYSTLLLLVMLHLGINYLAVRGVILRTLNRQRAALAWCMYRGPIQPTEHCPRAPRPGDVAQIESIFHRPEVILDDSGTPLGHCSIGSSIGTVLSQSMSIPTVVFDTLKNEKYVLWFDPKCLSHRSSPDSPVVIGTPHIHIFLKEGHRSFDHLRAWLHAIEVARSVKREMLAQREKLRNRVGNALQNQSGKLELELDGGALEASKLMSSAYEVIKKETSSFVDTMISEKWAFSNVDGVKELEVSLMTGPPITVIADVLEEDGLDSEESRKSR